MLPEDCPGTPPRLSGTGATLSFTGISCGSRHGTPVALPAGKRATQHSDPRATEKAKWTRRT